jgi:hypothetical protein
MGTSRASDHRPVPFARRRRPRYLGREGHLTHGNSRSPVFRSVPPTGPRSAYTQKPHKDAHVSLSRRSDQGAGWHKHKTALDVRAFRHDKCAREHEAPYGGPMPEGRQDNSGSCVSEGISGPWPRAERFVAGERSFRAPAPFVPRGAVSSRTSAAVVSVSAGMRGGPSVCRTPRVRASPLAAGRMSRPMARAPGISAASAPSDQ